MKKFRSIWGVSIVASLFVAGCGGSGGHVGGPASGMISYTGSETGLGTSTAAATVPATGGTTVTLDTGTATVPSGSVPSGTTLPAGTIYAILHLGTGFAGTFPGTTALAVNSVVDSGALVTSQGFLGEDVALPVDPVTGTSYVLSFPGGSLSTRVLTVEQIIFNGAFYFRSGAIVSPVPVAIQGRIPNNGQNAAGSSVTATWGPGNNGRTASLFIDYGNGFTLQRSRTISNNSAVFSDLFIDGSAVPKTGVKTVTFTVGPL